MNFQSVNYLSYFYFKSSICSFSSGTSGYLKAQVQQTIKLREELFSTLQKIEEVKVYPSATNFLTFLFMNVLQISFKYLLVNDFAVRDVGSHPVYKIV